MKTYIVTMYVSIEAETEEAAREIAFSLEVAPKNEAERDKISYDAQNSEVAEGVL